LNPQKLHWATPRILRASATAPIQGAAILTLVFVLPYWQGPWPARIAIGLAALAGLFAPSIAKVWPLMTPGSATRADVVDGLRRWASDRGFSEVTLKGAATLPSRGYPFAGFDQQGLDLVVKKRIGTHDVLVMLMWLGQEAENDATGGAFFTVVAAHVAADFPTTVVAPRGMGGTVRRALGPGLEVESGEFNREWRVFTTTLEDAHAILSPTVIEMLLDRDPRDTLPIQWDGNAVLTTSDGYTAVPERLDARVDLVGMLAGSSLALKGTSDAGASADAFLTTSTRAKVELDLAETLVVGFGMIALFSPIPLGAMYPDLSVPIVGFAWLGVFVGMVLFVNVHRRRRLRKARREWVDRYRSGKP
jgi:hypothetical protein